MQLNDVKVTLMFLCDGHSCKKCNHKSGFMGTLQYGLPMCYHTTIKEHSINYKDKDILPYDLEFNFHYSGINQTSSGKPIITFSERDTLEHKKMIENLVFDQKMEDEENARKK